MNRRAHLTVVLLVLLLAAAIAWRMFVGESLFSLSADELPAYLSIRAWRVATGAAVGLCLAVAGVLLQALLRNPLASPDIMGMSSAASLGVMLSIYLSAGAADPFALAVRPWQAAPALAGALGALALVYILSQRRGLIDPTALVLIGVIVSVMCGAGVLLIQHLIPAAAMTAGAMRLLVGAISDDVSRAHLLAVAALGVLATLLAARLGPAMDAASLGDDEATSLGVPIRPFRLALLALAGLLTAGAVVLAGPLGFIGLVAPHAVRLLAGPGLGAGRSREGSGGGKWRAWGGNRLVVIGSALAGPTLVIGADALVRSFHFSAGRMPIGIVTALLGGAVFIALLRAEQRR